MENYGRSIATYSELPFYGSDALLFEFKDNKNLMLYGITMHKAVGKKKIWSTFGRMSKSVYDSYMDIYLRDMLLVKNLSCKLHFNNKDQYNINFNLTPMAMVEDLKDLQIKIHFNKNDYAILPNTYIRVTLYALTNNRPEKISLSRAILGLI
jgi:hypothetical protein